MYLDFTRRVLGRLLLCLFEIPVQFTGLGALLFLVLFDALLNALRDQSRLLLGLPGTLRATRNPQGFLMDGIRLRVFLRLLGHGLGDVTEFISP